MEEKKYIHYGSTRFDPKRFVPIKNREFFVKPTGGFWASPVNGFGWKEWNEVEEFAECNEDNSFTFTITPEAKILHLETEEDFAGLPKLPSFFPFIMLNFEKLVEMGYDGIEMIQNGVTNEKLYGWDCDSILIMNPKIIK